MKVGLFMLLLTPAAFAQASTGYSPTMPFGVPAHSTQTPVNSGPGLPSNYDPMGYYYYYYGGGLNYSSRAGNTVPASSLPGYERPLKARTLPGYDRPAASSSPPGYSRPRR